MQFHYILNNMLSYLVYSMFQNYAYITTFLLGTETILFINIASCYSCRRTTYVIRMKYNKIDK